MTCQNITLFKIGHLEYARNIGQPGNEHSVRQETLLPEALNSLCEISKGFTEGKTTLDLDATCELKGSTYRLRRADLIHEGF